jgi:predicted transcriptional regulator
MAFKEKGTGNNREGTSTSPDELKILASTESDAKLIENISRDTQIPLERCRLKINGLVDLGLLVVEHDSDLYGHEVVKVRRVSKELDS